MWGTLGKGVQGFVGAALENVSKISKELEAEMNAAVLNENENNTIIKEEDKKEIKDEIKVIKENNNDSHIDNNNNNNLESKGKNKNQNKSQVNNNNSHNNINNSNNNNESENIIQDKLQSENIPEKKVKRTTKKLKSDTPSAVRILSRSPSPPLPPPIIPTSIIDESIISTTTTNNNIITTTTPISAEITSSNSQSTLENEQQQQQSDNVMNIETPQKEKVAPKRLRKIKTTTEIKSLPKIEQDQPTLSTTISQQNEENEQEKQEQSISSIIIQQQQQQQQQDFHDNNIDTTPTHISPQIHGSVKEKIQVFEKMKHEEKIILNHIEHHHQHQDQHQDHQDHQNQHQHQNHSTIETHTINDHHLNNNDNNEEILLLQNQIQDLVNEKVRLIQMYDEKLSNFENHKQQEHLQYTKKIEILNQNIQSLHQKNQSLENENTKLINELTQKNDSFNAANLKLSSQMKNEMDNLGEVIAERERALQSANVQLAEIHRQYEESLSKLSSLSSELSETKQLYKQSQVSEMEYKRENIKLQEVLKEKEESLIAFTNEGQALAKKQGEMEKNIRKSRGEIREKEVEIGKLKEKCDQHLKTIEELREVIRQHESNSNSLQKQNTVIQSVSQASQDKITKLENDLSLKVEELNGQRKALELSWSENSDLKRTIAELKAECESLKSQIGLGENKVTETESTRRDLEQREAILRATNRQLQESLQRYMTESATREERMREELKEARNKWQEAIAHRESLAAELGNVSTPLLRQITSLQESLRVKTDVWQKMESTLSERAIRAENLAENSERKRLGLEEELGELKQKLKNIEHQLEESNEQNKNNTIIIDRMKRSEQDSIERINKLQNLLKEESTQRISFENSIRDLEYQNKRNIEQIKDEYQKKIDGYEYRINQLQSDMTNLNHQVEGKKLEQQQRILKNEQLQSNKDIDNDRIKRNKPGYKPVENESFAITERSHQTILQQDEKIEHLQKQIQQIQVSRDALLEEVSYLSSKLSLYEDNMKSFDSLSNERKKLKEQNETLLILLGEKEEELENIFNDMKEIKNLYREEMNRLIEKSIN